MTPGLLDVRVLFNQVPALEGIGPWVDLNLAQGALYDHDLAGPDWARLLTATLIWVAVPAAIGAVRVLRSEVTSS